MLIRQVRIVNPRGLHARASAKFVNLADTYDADIYVEKDGERVEATSIMGLMMLAASIGSDITILADGNEAETALNALENLVATGFGELAD